MGRPERRADVQLQRGEPCERACHARARGLGVSTQGTRGSGGRSSCPSLQGAWRGHSASPGLLCDLGQSPIFAGPGWGQEGRASWATEEGRPAPPEGFRPSGAPRPALDTALGGRVDRGVHKGACFFVWQHGSRPCLLSCVPIRASVSPSVNGVHLSCVRCIEGSQRSMQEALSKRSVLAAGGSGQTSVLLRDPESLSAHPGNPQGHP